MRARLMHAKYVRPYLKGRDRLGTAEVGAAADDEVRCKEDG
jgi:hypothetical protein